MKVIRSRRRRRGSSRTQSRPRLPPTVEYFHSGTNSPSATSPLRPSPSPTTPPDPCRGFDLRIPFRIDPHGCRNRFSATCHPNVKSALKRIDVLPLESNCTTSRCSATQPPALGRRQQRPISRVGHLSNHATARIPRPRLRWHRHLDRPGPSFRGQQRPRARPHRCRRGHPEAVRLSSVTASCSPVASSAARHHQPLTPLHIMVAGGGHRTRSCRPTNIRDI